jgi:hypothetical protein
VVRVSANAAEVTAVCGAGTHIGGGGAVSTATTGSGGNASGNIEGDFPSTTAGTPVANGSTNPPAWSAIFFEADPTNTAFALCVPN